MLIESGPGYGLESRLALLTKSVPIYGVRALRLLGKLLVRGSNERAKSLFGGEPHWF